MLKKYMSVFKSMCQIREVIFSKKTQVMLCLLEECNSAGNHISESLKKKAYLPE